MSIKEVRLSKEVEEISQQIIEWRRHFHKNPEPSLKEFKTSAKVKALLEEWGVPYQGVGQTGVLATIKGGLGEGSTILLRADMDALELDDKTQCSYTSQNEGVNHACGHDGHTASLLGAVKVLKDKEFKGTIKFAFQAAEEVGLGAKEFIDGGHLQGVDLTFGIHLHSPMEVGKVIAAVGPRSASCDIFEIEVSGESAHCSKPHEGRDALMAGSHIAVSLQSIVSRRIDPLHPVVIAIGEMHAGTKYNIVAGKALLKGTLRAFEPKTRELALEQIEQVAQDTAKIYGTTAEFRNFATSPSLINKEKEVELAKKVLMNIVGEDNIVEHMPASLGGEDFADFLEYVPGLFLHVGTRNLEDEGTWYPHHHERFDIDERALPIATQIHVDTALAFLAQE